MNISNIIYVNEATTPTQFAKENYDWIEVVDGSALRDLMVKYKISIKQASNILRDAFVTGYDNF
jgi:Mor family transcriptional regulator